MRTDTHRLEARGCAAAGLRRGAVAVEFAAVAPLLLAIVVGLLELTRVYSVQNTLETACREGARFAALDRTGMLDEDESANDKLKQDVKNYLASTGINPTQVDVRVTKANDPNSNFDLEDPANDMELFQVRVEVPYSEISYSPVRHVNDHSLSAALTFRNGRANVSE